MMLATKTPWYSLLNRKQHLESPLEDDVQSHSMSDDKLPSKMLTLQDTLVSSTATYDQIFEIEANLITIRTTSRTTLSQVHSRNFSVFR